MRRTLCASAAAAAALGLMTLTACGGGPASDPAGDHVRGGRALASPVPARPAPSPAPPEPFDVVLEHIEMIPASNAEIVGAAAPAADHAEVELAADRSRRVLQRFLDAQFLAEGTRFGAAPLHDLLTPPAQAALTPADRLGLGVLHLAVNRVTTGPASARAAVVFDGSDVRLVTLTFTAQLQVGFGERPPTLPVVQSGTLAFVPSEAGWRVAAADVHLEAPEPPPPPTPAGAQ